MNCAIHTQTPAVAFCRTCGKALCTACRRDVRGVVFCEDCLANRVEGAIPAAAAVPPPPPPAGTPGAPAAVPGAPNPAAAVLLGLIPGVGAMYCGEFVRAFLHVVVFAALIAMADRAEFFGVLVAFWYFFMVFDSYRVAKAKQFGQPVPDLFVFGTTEPVRVPAFQAETRRAARGPIGAFVLIGLGALFLLDNLDVMHFQAGKLWPLFLIGLGAYLLYQRRSRIACQCQRCITRVAMGPAIIITVGVMGLLAEFTRFDWGRSWPLVLVVIGALRFWESTCSTEGHILAAPVQGVPASTAPTNTPKETEDSEAQHG